MNYRDFFDKHNVTYQEGLSDEEFKKIEQIYKIVFPNELRKLLKQVLPTSRGFYNWRNFSESNVENILQMIKYPFDDYYRRAEELEWNNDWGEAPKSAKEIGIIVREKLQKAPKLLPIYGHRYLPIISGSNIPVFSIWSLDTIYYGSTVDEYLQIEFDEKEHCEIDFSAIRRIPFWTDVIWM